MQIIPLSACEKESERARERESERVYIYMCVCIHPDLAPGDPCAEDHPGHIQARTGRTRTDGYYISMCVSMCVSTHTSTHICIHAHSLSQYMYIYTLSLSLFLSLSLSLALSLSRARALSLIPGDTRGKPDTKAPTRAPATRGTSRSLVAAWLRAAHAGLLVAVSA